MSFDDRLESYNDVASRMREFFEKHPEGRLRPNSPWRVETLDGKTFIVYEAAAYRTPDDNMPGIGTAWEPFPGRNPYTRDSELMNAETSAWGRAILAVGAADTKKGVATREEVRNRQADQDANWEEAKPARLGRGQAAEARQQIIARGLAAIGKATSRDELTALGLRVTELETGGAITADDAANLRHHIVTRLEELFPTAAGAEPASATTPVSEKQRRRMHALFRDIGLGGPGDDVRSLRLAKVALIIGRDVDTTNDLTAAEADQVNAALDAERKEKTPPVRPSAELRSDLP